MTQTTVLSLPDFHGGASHRRAWHLNAGAGGGRTPASRPVQLLGRVTLWRSVRVEGLLIAASARGTLVDIAHRGDFGTVEFDWPLHAVVTLPMAELRPAPR